MAATDFEEKLKLVKSVQSAKDFATRVPRHGVSLNFLQQHLSGAKLGGERVKTMYDLERYVLTLTERWGCTFAEMLKEVPGYAEAVADAPTYFITCAYSTDLEVVLSAIDRYTRKEGREDSFVWISFLSLNMHFGKTKGEQTAAVVCPESWFNKKDLKVCLEVAQNLLLVMSPLAKPVALQRLWCVYELWLALSTEHCTVHVILSEEDEQYLMNHLLEDSSVVLRYIESVDVKTAKSSSPYQKEKLRREIESIAGYYATNYAMRKVLRKWFVNTATTYIGVMKETYKQNMPMYIKLLRTVAELFHGLGHRGKAEDMAEEVLSESREYYKKDDPECV